MDAITAAILILTLSLSSFPSLSAAAPCKPESCHAVLGPEIRFPFRVLNRQSASCGSLGFELRCNPQNQTILTLPESGSFVVDHIDYAAQALFINDPDSCLPGRILNFSASGSPFRGAYTRSYTFLNCSSDFMDYGSTRYTPLFCLSGRNHTVLATRSDSSAPAPETCRRIKSVEVPLEWTLSQFEWASMDLREDLELVWYDPLCRDCEIGGGICGFKDDRPGSRVACFRRSRSALPRSAKYGIIIGVGIPGLVCLIGLTCYACGMIRAANLRRRLNPDLPVTISDQRPVIRSVSGLDAPTIESYPTTVLGESRRLPKVNDVCCPICLSDYQPKETLRSIPECNHYFHANCIDEWLKLNGSCPLCRNSPVSSTATPCFSLSVSSLSSSPSTSDSR
ncbi:putative RING-H2 finger protein ATL21B [Salvia miltiorrhiza]|uniref:putative RING-H2 finger protein ATL21B n=1 Tax=Salvia miltiorrhiza TaxID=226208 RepID=UPI0025AD3829|nr:putative RING-H2 finger protein ATL21B [Salvia miltiorrhiza]